MKILTADSVVSAERALNAAIVNYAHRHDGEALSLEDLHVAVPRDPKTVKPS